MSLIDLLKKHNPEKYTFTQSAPPQERESAPALPAQGNPYAPQAVSVTPEPVGAVQPTSQQQDMMAGFTQNVERFLPAIEQLTGLSRREIFLHLIKAGIRGGGVNGILEGLLGQKPPQEAKFVRMVKTMAIWVPIGVGMTFFCVILPFALLRHFGLI
jgi:hypothetical protein